jgi:formate-dependent nitrite reductase cytochrome c552 subunit
MKNMKKRIDNENIQFPNINTIEAALKEMKDIRAGKREKKDVNRKSGNDNELMR